MTDSAFPIRGTVDCPDPGPTVLPFEDAESVFDALASETAREVVATLREAPGPPSGIAERADTSLQNAIYHLSRLADCGVVEVVDTWYSSRGVEMDVYALATDSLVIDLDDAHDGSAPLGAAEERPGSDVALVGSD